jgi:16S rRNA processing protein RimM
LHGIKGKVLVESMTDNPQRFYPGSRLWVGFDESRLKCVEIVDSTLHKGKHLVYLAGHVSEGSGEEEILDPGTLKGKLLFVPTEDLVDTREDEYYYHELIGCLVGTATGEEIGIVDTVIRTGPQDILVLEDKERGEVLIPMVSDIVKEVDVKKGRIVIDPPDGLLDANVSKC